MKKTDLNASRRGFTLIELLIVVAIIAILAAIAVPNFLEAQTRAKVSRCKADERTIALALEAYRVGSNCYPEGQGVSSLDTRAGSDLMKWLTTPIAFMTSLPAETPFGSAAYNMPDVKGYLYTGGGDKWFRPYMLQMIDTYHYFDLSWKYLDWDLIAPGPTKKCSLMLTNPALVTPYDPTNGTVSVGDIIDIGGPGRGVGWHSFK